MLEGCRGRGQEQVIRNGDFSCRKKENRQGRREGDKEVQIQQGGGGPEVEKESMIVNRGDCDGRRTWGVGWGVGLKRRKKE